MKSNLKNITFCIPVRVDSIYRLENLYYILSYLSSRFYTNIVIIEADKYRNIKDIPSIKNLKYYFIEDNDPIFHRTKYINTMLFSSQTDFAAIWDTDIFTYAKQIEESYRIVEHMGYSLVYPYDGRMYSLSETISGMLKNNKEFNPQLLENLSISLLNGYHSVGGAYLVNIRRYLECGGENENFYGWGPEDVERKIRLEIMGEVVFRNNGPLFHLFHPRGINSKPANKEIAIKNITELTKICSLRKNELLNYIQSWKWYVDRRSEKTPL